jgi:truncated hemoglobin YjbI
MSDTQQVLNEADQALADLHHAVGALRHHTTAVDQSLSRYTFTVLVSAAEGVLTPEEFEEIGGVNVVRKAVRILYDKVMADPELAPYFIGADMIYLRQQQVKMFLALMGAKDYEGVTLRVAHEEHYITKKDFDKMVKYVAESLSEVGMQFEKAEAVLDRVRGFEGDIVNEGPG